MCGQDTSNSGSGGLGFKPGPSCCFLRQGILRHFVSLHPGVYMGTSDILLRGNPVMDKHPVRGEVAILLGMLHAKESGISFSHLSLWLTCDFTFYFACWDYSVYLKSVAISLWLNGRDATVGTHFILVDDHHISLPLQESWLSVYSWLFFKFPRSRVGAQVLNLDLWITSPSLWLGTRPCCLS